MAVSVNLNKWNQLSEYEPDVDHFDIGGGGQRLGHTDEEGGQHQQRGQVHCNLSLKEEWFEEVGGVDNTDDEDCREVGGEELIDDPSVHDNLQINSLIYVTWQSFDEILVSFHQHYSLSTHWSFWKRTMIN